jgi:hypothetical protein
MQRYYFISDDLDDLQGFERDLEAAGIPQPQLHLLTLDDAEAESREGLHEVHSLMKKDLIHSGEYGLVLGIVAAALVIVVTWLAGWYENVLGWAPFVFLAIIVLGFFAWEGGFIGIQTFNVNFRRFRRELEQGRHVFFVDLARNQKKTLDRVVQHHPSTRLAGTGRSAPHWLVSGQQRLRRLLFDTLP